MKYKAFVNGKELTMNYARVSKMPFNMVWKGYQRAYLQTELAWFVSFDMDEKAALEIQVLDAEVETAVIRPLEYGIEYTVNGNVINVSLDKPMKFVLEVNGIHETLNVFANEKQAYVRDENTIYFGKGEHHPGMIYPKSGQTVYIDEGAVVYGGIYVYKQDNVSVVGRGILDSSELLRGDELTTEDKLYKELSAMALTDRDIRLITGFTAYECNNFTVDGIVLRDAPFWSMIIRNGCNNVNINNVKLIGQWRYNADGFDLCASMNIRLTNCFVRSFDDSVVIRAVDLDGETTPCDNILVENNVLWCDWGKNLEVWCGDKNALVKNVTFKNNYLVHVTDYAISIDTWFGAPSITVDNVQYENIFIDTQSDIMTPVLQENAEHEYPCTDKAAFDNRKAVWIGVGRLGKNLGNQACDFSADCSEYVIKYKHITLNNVICNGETKLPVKISSQSLKELSDVTINNCDVGKFLINN